MENQTGKEFEQFYQLCSSVEKEINKSRIGSNEQLQKRMVEREKLAMLGFNSEKEYLKTIIREVLIELGISKEYMTLGGDIPTWYPNLVEGIFSEIYGLSGLDPWINNFLDKYKNSSSAKLIGENLFCLINGKSELQAQKISSERREKLKRTLLLAAPKERLEYGFHEIYMKNGIRITIFSGDRTKAGQDIMVFRKYLIEKARFEDLAEKGTIPKYAIRIFENMVDEGYNVLFSGQVRSGKTTFLRVWQSYEDESLEGVAIATDPETPWHKLMPGAPIMQLIADGEELEHITKSILRGDNDYIIMEEMRDATAYNVALEMLSIGSKRCKMTIHDNHPKNIPYKMASKIRERYGGEFRGLLRQIYSNYDFCFHFGQDEEDRSKKYLLGIYIYSWDEVTGGRTDVICEIKKDLKSWSWYPEHLPEKYTALKKQIEGLEAFEQY